jgi:hypothetical protein
MFGTTRGSLAPLAAETGLNLFRSQFTAFGCHIFTFPFPGPCRILNVNVYLGEGHRLALPFTGRSNAAGEDKRYTSRPVPFRDRASSW